MFSTKLISITSNTDSFAADLVVFFSQQNKKGVLATDLSVKSKELEQAIALGDYGGDDGETLLIYPQKDPKCNDFSGRQLFVGLGSIFDKSDIELREQCRITGGLIAKAARKLKIETLSLTVPCIKTMELDDVAECIVEGLLLGDYSFDKYQKEDSKKPNHKGIKKISVYSTGKQNKMEVCLKRAKSSAYAARSARNMANEPGNQWTADSFAQYASELAKKYTMKCSILTKRDMKRLKMGGILAVNQGSSEPPKMVILQYKAKRDTAQTLLIVGKGLTFDSGGVSLKPGAGMQDMKYDMCGGAAALSVMAVVGEEKPDVNVIAIIPATDNMGGSSALKPGDIIRHYGGITSEIINTDAEGRLILADALAYGIKKYAPDCVIDLATLTGAVIMGLGHHRTGLLGNNQNFLQKVLIAGERCGEPLWQLPLDKEYSDQIKSTVADIKNTGGRPAGTITAAAYLQKFVGDTPWAHLDIAGTAWDFTKKSYIPKGPSGTGVRTLAELIRNWKKHC